MKRWLVFDTETSGLPVPSSAPLEKQPKIIDLALVEVSFGIPPRSVASDPTPIWHVTNEFQRIINPGEPLYNDTKRITGITEDDVRGQPTFSEILPDLIQFVHGATGLIAHNLPFDLNLLAFELRRCGREHAFPYPPEQMCTVANYHPVFGRRAKLTEVYLRVMGKELAQKHRALDDARALAEIVIKEELVS